MAFNIILRSIVYKDIYSSARWYEAESRGLGTRFVKMVYETFDSIAEAPHGHRKVNLEVRRAKVKVFPYLVLFIIEAQYIIILGVIHSKRGTGFIHNRLA